MSGWRLPLRLARRELRRRPGHGALVVSLIAVPVAAMVLAGVGWRTQETSGDLAARLGSADLVLVVSSPGGMNMGTSPVDIDAALPLGSRWVATNEFVDRIRLGKGRHVGVSVVSAPWSDPLTDGFRSLEAGRFPEQPDEFALSPELADKLGLALGDRVEPGGSFGGVLVGLARSPSSLRSDMVLLAGSSGRWIAYGQVEVLVDLPPGTAVPHIDLPLISSATPAAAGLDAPVHPPLLVAGALGLVVTATLAAAAFAISARRQIHTMGLLSGSGAQPSMLYRVLAAQGLLSGIAGAAAGVAAALAILAAASPWRDWLTNRLTHSWSIAPADIWPPAVLAIAAGTISAAQAGRVAARVGPVGALAAHRPQDRPARWLAPSGIAATLTGLVILAFAARGSSSFEGMAEWTIWAVVTVVSGLTIYAGVCLLAPALVDASGRLGSRLPVTGRMALRDLGRHRSRNTAAIVAMGSAMALALVVSSATASEDAAVRPDATAWLPREVVLFRAWSPASRVSDNDLDTVRQIVAPVAEGRLREVPTRDFPARVIEVSPETAANLGLGDAAVAQLSADRPVVIGGTKLPAELVLLDGSTRLALTGAHRENRSAFQPLVVLSPKLAASFAPPQRAAGEPGYSDAAVVLRAARPLTLAQRAELVDLEWTARRPMPAFLLEFRSPRRPLSGLVQWIAAPAAGFLVLFSVGMVLALSATEGRRDRLVLAALGASPGRYRNLTVAKATTLVVTALLLALPAGIVPPVIWALGTQPAKPVVLPWLALALLTLVLPVLVALSAWLGARPRRAMVTAALAKDP